MRTKECLRYTSVAAALYVLAVFGLVHADDQTGKKAESPKTFDKQIRAALPKVIDSGADLFNEGDRAGCYHDYLGSLLTPRPDLQWPGEKKRITGRRARNRR